jgi:hypothetical protein
LLLIAALPGPNLILRKRDSPSKAKQFKILFFANFANWRRDELALVLRIENFGSIANGIANYRTLIQGGQFGRARG